MSLTIAEANAVNTLLSALTGQPHPGSDLGLPPDEDQVGEAATLLAARAHRTLGAGWDGPAAALAVEQTYADRAARAVKDWRDQVVVEFERQAARAIACRLDGDELIIDGDEWISDGTSDFGDVLELTHPSGRQVVTRVAVEVVEGSVA